LKTLVSQGFKNFSGKDKGETPNFEYSDKREIIFVISANFKGIG